MRDVRRVALFRSLVFEWIEIGRLHWQNKDGVPLHLSAWMEFEDGAVGHFDCSFNAPFRCSHRTCFLGRYSLSHLS